MSEEYSGFDLTIYNLFTLLREMYYTRGETETNFLLKSGGTVAGSLTIQGNLVVNGQSYSIDTENLRVGDYTITLAKDNENTLTSMVGMVVPKYDGTNYGFFGWDADGYAYVGDLTNWDGSSAITLANNSSLQKVATIDTTNTVVASNGVIYVYDATSHCFKKPTNDNKYYVIRNGAFVETELFTEQKSKNIDNALYNIGAFDSVSGNTITRQTGYVDLSKLNWQYQSAVGCWYAENVIPNATECVASNYTCYNNTIYSSLVNGELTTNNAGWGAIDTIIIKDSQSNYPIGILQYKLSTSYTEDVIPNQPLLNLDQAGCDFVRDEYEKTCNLAQLYGNYYIDLSTGAYISDSGTWSSYKTKVYANQKYTFNGNCYSYYNLDGTYISQPYWNANNSDITFTPTSDRLVVISRNTNNKLMLNKGTHAMPYQEYCGEIVHKGDIEPVLLWENPSPTNQYPDSSSASTTVAPSDMSKYKYTILAYTDDYGSEKTVKYQKVEYKAGGKFIISGISQDTTVVVPYSRLFEFVSATSLKIYCGYASQSLNNRYVIPIAIYGTNVL